ncbi:hypothetical protein D3227_32505 [Mesorhizobium waimense]|uniref:Uncharacterized protein n=1 Tax=Mesorhizobium waimense TaxID=1300307 RepID=A0A3A5KE70_9HYPH|nr:hypothetical protein D3227_32505 [Mesorhizobium waimense]
MPGFGLIPLSDLSLSAARKGLQCRIARNFGGLFSFPEASFQEEKMDESVGQARWLLAPVFGMCIIFMTIGIFLG